MTEVPDYLLQRSRERRAALGLSTGDGGDAAAPAADAGESAPVPATTAAATPAPVADSATEIETYEPPAPIAPWVAAAKSRKKIPVWMAPVALFLPIWGFLVYGTLEEPTREAAGPIAAGSGIYSNCASCHGAGGGGGVGYQLNDGEVLLTFPDVASHVAWVVNGSPAAGTPYGNPDRPGGQRISGALGSQMPAFASLGGLEVLEVTLYNRVSHGQQPEEDLEPWVLWAESGTVPDWEQGVLPQQIEADFQEFLSTNPEAAAMVEEMAAAE
ncbi:MAG: c-type cytochrome [Acidimicrobiales bacterium]